MIKQILSWISQILFLPKIIYYLQRWLDPGKPVKKQIRGEIFFVTIFEFKILMVYPFTNYITRYIHVLRVIISAILYELSLSVAISYCLDELHALLKASDILHFTFCLWPMHLFDSSVSAFSILFSKCFIPFLSQFKNLFVYILLF